MEITRRYRVGVSTSVKGIHTFDCTVEVVSDLDEASLRAITITESDALVAELDKRYPAVEEKPGKII